MTDAGHARKDNNLVEEASGTNGTDGKDGDCSTFGSHSHVSSAGEEESNWECEPQFPMPALFPYHTGFTSIQGGDGATTIHTPSIASSTNHMNNVRPMQPAPSLQRKKVDYVHPLTALSSVSGSHSSLRSSVTSTNTSLRRSDVTNESTRQILEPFRESAQSAKLKKYMLETLGRKGERLYGREEQINRLKSIFADTTTTPAGPAGRKKQLVIMEGSAGSGKSALAHQLKSAADPTGFVMGGKFDQQQVGSTEPYTVWKSATRDLTDALLAHHLDPHTGDNNWNFSCEDVSQALREQLTEDGTAQILTDIFPDLIPVIGGTYLRSRPGTPTNFEEAKNSLRFALRRLMRVLSAFAPIVVTIDDAQWADGASLEMLQCLLTDPEQDSLMVVVCIRPEEITQEHAFAAFLKGLSEDEETTSSAEEPNSNTNALTTTDQQRSKPCITEIKVQNLTTADIQSMLEEVLSLHATSEDSMLLTECIHRKTAGNPLFVIQFLQLLVVDNLLTHNVGSMQWSWDIDQINLSQASTLNVVEMVQEKLTRLSAEIQQVLPVVACLGNRCPYGIFETTFLFVHREDTEAISPEEFLLTCQEAGLLAPLTSNQSICWEHDKLCEAALKLVSQDELASLRYELGTFLLNTLSSADVERNVFLVAHLLDDAASILNGTGEDNVSTRLRLVQLNLSAGKKAMNTLASVSAVPFLVRGINLLPDGHWQVNYELSLNLYSLAAEAHFRGGEPVAAREYCNQVFEQKNRPLMDKRRCHTVVLNSMWAGGDLTRIREYCFELLSKLGCKFPRRGRIFYILRTLLQIKTSLKQAEDKILGLATMKKPEHIWSMKLINTLCSALYSYDDDPTLFPVVILKGFNLILKYGIGEYSPAILAIIALVLGTMGDFNGAKVYSEIALRLFDRTDMSKLSYSRTLWMTSSLSLHYTVPFDQLKKACLHGYREGLSNGDTESAMWSCYQYTELSLHTGSPLKSLVKDCDQFAVQMKDLKQMLLLTLGLAVFQIVLNLMATTAPEEPHDLTGDVFDWRQSSLDPKVTRNFHRYRVMMSFWAGDYKATVRLLEEREATQLVDKLNLGHFSLSFFHTQAAVACYHQFRRTKERKYRRMARASGSKVRGWAAKKCPNVQHLAMLVKAEELAGRGKFLKAIQAFKTSILMAGRLGCINYQALANERLGVYYWSLEWYEEGSHHISIAAKLYEEWGNERKCALMREICPRISVPPTIITTSEEIVSAAFR